MTDRPGPLAGVRVLDLGQIYNGPYCSFMMAMAGAEVIKIEPTTGENLRRRAEIGRAALPFAMLNSNKRFVTLDLKSEAGRKLFLDMVPKSDVVVENFAPGVMDRLGLGYDVLSAINPRIVYASGSGYGLSGPHKDLPAMDITVQAMSGAMSVNGWPDRPPVKVGPAICDFYGGVHLYAALVSALFERERTGQGRMVEVAMEDATIASLASNIGLYYSTSGDVPQRTGNRHGGLAEAPYNVYPTSDGFIAIICAGEVQWNSLLDAVGRPELKDDPRFMGLKARVANVDAVDALVSAFTERRSKQEVFDILLKHRVPCAPVRDVAEVLTDPHMHERRMLQSVEHPLYGSVVLPGSPLRFIGTAPTEVEPSGELGRDNRAVFEEVLGLRLDEISSLKAAGVI